MFNTIIIAHKLFWLACDTTKLRLKFILSYIFGTVEGLLVFASSLVVANIVSSVNNKNLDMVLSNFYIFILLGILLLTGRFSWRFHIENIGKIIPLNIKEIYYKKLYHKEYNWHINNSVGYFSSALEKVCEMARVWIWKIPFVYLSNFILILCFLFYTLHVSIYLFSYFLISLFIVAVMIRFLYVKRLGFVDDYNRATIDFDKFYLDFLYNVRSVKKMNLLPFVWTMLRPKKDDAVKKGINLMRYNTWQYGLLDFYIYCLFLLPIGYFIYQFVQFGSGLEIIILIIYIQPKISDFGLAYMGLMSEIVKTKVEYGILNEHLGSEPNKKDLKLVTKKWKKITFNNTEFDYLKDGIMFSHIINEFEIKKGDHIAVTGKSGDGKTTFLNLLTRQFSPKSGVILLDDIDYKDLSEDFFDNQIIYISQDVELFNMSFYDNIVMGKKISKTNFEKVIRGCCLEELVSRLDGNLNANIGEKGIKISGGERQRINLARGLLLNRDVLVLDEIANNLDANTIKSIWKFIFEEYKEKTIIAVSHEKELLKYVNKKIEFKNGKGAAVI